MRRVDGCRRRTIGWLRPVGGLEEVVQHRLRHIGLVTLSKDRRLKDRSSKAVRGVSGVTSTN